MVTGVKALVDRYDNTRRAILKIRTLPVAVALAVIAAGTTGWIVWDRTRSGVRTGHAFGADGAIATVGMRTVRKGDEVWYLSPALTNLTGTQLTLETVAPARVPLGFDPVDAGIYRRTDFPGGLPLSWGTADGPSSSPGRVPAMAIQGYLLEAGQEMDDVIYLHLHVTTDNRPLESSGVAVEYSQKGKRFRQILPHVFRLEHPTPASN
jgi:hypothetical protein